MDARRSAAERHDLHDDRHGHVERANGGDLGLFDPTTLADGAYTLRLTAWNAGGHVSSTSITVNVSGYLKLGNLDLSFTDLTMPVSGIPITITRTYNSLNADTVERLRLRLDA